MGCLEDVGCEGSDFGVDLGRRIEDDGWGCQVVEELTEGIPVCVDFGVMFGVVVAVELDREDDRKMIGVEDVPGADACDDEVPVDC